MKGTPENRNTSSFKLLKLNSNKVDIVNDNFVFLCAGCNGILKTEVGYVLRVEGISGGFGVLINVTGNVPVPAEASITVCEL